MHYEKIDEAIAAGDPELLLFRREAWGVRVLSLPAPYSNQPIRVESTEYERRSETDVLDLVGRWCVLARRKTRVIRRRVVGRCNQGPPSAPDALPLLLVRDELWLA